MLGLLLGPMSLFIPSKSIADSLFAVWPQGIQIVGIIVLSLLLSFVIGVPIYWLKLCRSQNEHNGKGCK